MITLLRRKFVKQFGKENVAARNTILARYNNFKSTGSVIGAVPRGRKSLTEGVINEV